jgi:hypothetical protein
LVATIVTHMMISLNNHIGRAPNTNASYKKVATIQQFDNVSEIKYRSVIEQEQQPPSGAQAFQYNLVEPSISVGAGTIVRVKNAVRTISEPAKTIAESLTKRVTHLIAEPAKTITEGLVKVKKANRPISEPAKTIGESLAKNVKRVKTISEPTNTIGESLVTNKHFNRTISESAITITEGLAKHAIKNRQITEPSTAITETLIHLKVAELTESPITVSEALAVSRVLTRSISEFSFPPTSFTLASFMHTTEITERLVKIVAHNLAETINITENLLRIRHVVRTFSETIPLQPETIQRLVTHYLNEPQITITSLLEASKTINRILAEPSISITESLVASRVFRRAINPTSFANESFTTDVFGSFNLPSEDVTTITEELEGFILPPGQEVLIEPAIEITELLEAHRTVFRTIAESPITIGESLTSTIPSPINIYAGGVSRRRRKPVARYPTLRQAYQYPRQPIIEIPEPIHEPLLFEVEINEQPVPITEALTSLKIVKERVVVSVAAAAPPPQIIEKERIVYQDRIVEKLVQPPPVIKAEDIIVSKPKPIEVEQDILVSTQSHSNKMKSKAASAQLQIIEELMVLSEMEEMI